MNKKNFKNLLTDMYTAYNPDHLKYVDGLVEKYIHMPLAAIDMTLFKYNHPTAPHHDPEKYTDEFKKQLFHSYSSGNRIFKDVDVYGDLKEKQALQKKRQEEEERIKTEKEEEQRRLSDKKIEEISSSTDEKLGKVSQQLEDQLRSFSERVEQIIEEKTKIEESMDIDVQINYTDEEVIMPNPKHMAALGKEARIIARTKPKSEGEPSKPIGLIIKDIIYDSFSFDDRTLVQIIIDKE